MRSEFFRFLLVGASNTVLSWVLFALLVQFMPYLAAYTLAYVLSIVNSYFLNVCFVFKERISVTAFLKFPVVYMLQYALGALLMWLLAEQAGMRAEIAMMIVIFLTSPVTFLMSRIIIKPGTTRNM